MGPEAPLGVTWEDVTAARLLIIDDAEANVRVLTRILERAGYTNIKGSTNPLETLPLVENYDPDLILLDLHMPGRDGFEVMELLRPRLPRGVYLPILVLTGDLTPEVKRRALSAGAKDFLTKPFDREEVVLRIRNLLETRFLYLEAVAQRSG